MNGGNQKGLKLVGSRLKARLIPAWRIKRALNLCLLPTPNLVAT